MKTLAIVLAGLTVALPPRAAAGRFDSNAAEAIRAERELPDSIWKRIIGNR
jgi:hypothetical protein